ncbi:hypothetical protein N7537_008400 [Penicillium hordei]|uniref:Uncharacterized protein n=1 Tax=Penicillium hordei TaxID=40994 RepID=A0AAD6E0E4_9EURO|nr:uncharacterized protein N7537_008400 [Penicillium hordei]KAJ5598316.1 hypothetical protein N7537_008400 [Penicillium hordei]
MFMSWDQAIIQLRSDDTDIPSGRLSICRSPASRALWSRGTPDLTPQSLNPQTSPLCHPILGAKHNIPPLSMGSTSVFAKTILIPAAIALSIYILASCVIFPFFRRYHQRYSQYLPLHSISAHTLSLRDRIADKVMHFCLPSRWRWGAHIADHDTESIDDEEGEILVGMDMDSVRRGTLEQQRRDNLADTESRLSRDLEEGFMDDSDSEGSERSGHGRRGRL